jgi:hypothetical protein
MAYYFNGATTHHLDRADAAIQTWPITLHGRIRLLNPADGLTHAIVGLWESSSNNGFRILVELNGGVMKARCGSKAGGVASSATTTNSIGDSNWHSVVGEISASNARQVWLDNAGNGSNTTSLFPGTLTKTTIGSIDNGGSYSSGAGHELADIAVWAGTLTFDEREALKLGVSSELIRPDLQKLHAQLIGTPAEDRGGPFSVTGATVVEHPSVFLRSPSRTIVRPPPATFNYSRTFSQFIG